MSWSDRYTKSYGIPKGRPQKIAVENSEHRYKYVRTIDAPGNGAVGGLNKGIFLVKRKRDGKIVVQKNIYGKEKILRREIHLLHHLRHENIVEFVDAFITPDRRRKASLFIEYCDLGSLHGLVERYNKKAIENPRSVLPEKFIWHVFESLTNALQYIHHGLSWNDPSPAEPGTEMKYDYRIARRLKRDWPVILHRDIKLHNILLCHPCRTQKPLPSLFCFLKTELLKMKPPYPRVVLADFGAACQSQDEDWASKDETATGTIHWMPPELPAWSERGDIWALGAVIYSLCKLLPGGPLPPPPVGSEWEDDRQAWYRSKEARQGIADLNLRGEYTESLDNAVFNCLQGRIEDRPFAFRLVEFLSFARAEAKRSGRVEHGELPRWVFDDG